MSGICAVWRKDNPGAMAETLSRMGGALALSSHERFLQKTDGGAGLGVSSRFATQQVYGDEHVLIACDADLTNEGDLRALAGDRVTGTAALLAALYVRFGASFVEKLRGGFSLVLWDRRERKLLAAVDIFGIQRLVYRQAGNTVLIASRIDALTQTGETSRDINPRAIASFLNYGVDLAPQTIFADIHRLTPGSLLLASAGQVRVEKYWDMRYGVEGDGNEARLSRELEAVVEQSVAAHAKSDSPGAVGAYLSGGTDSSTVVGMMARTGQDPVKTFSIGFSEERFNELGYAQITADKFKADHHTYLVTPQDCFDAIPGMVRSFDEPFGNSSAIPTYFCGRLAAQNGVNVLLAGDGGDELFGGNDRYPADKVFALYHAVPALLRKGLIEPVSSLLPAAGVLRKARNYIRRSNMPPIQRYFSYNFLSYHTEQHVLDADFLRSLGEYSVLDIPTRHYAEASARDHLDRLLYVDVKITLGDSDLPKVTCMSELAGIQTRFPFLDQAVAEFSGRVPARLKVKGFKKRYLFKKAFRNLLPIEVIKKKKHGFGIPVAYWLKSDVRLREFSRDILLSARAAQRGYLRRGFIEDLLGKYAADDTTYYGDTLWAFLVLELWHRQFVDQPVSVAV
jgi:asparagine synthase (glutamine-hydrolysing)